MSLTNNKPMPSADAVAAAEAEIATEDRAYAAQCSALAAAQARRAPLPSEHPDHTCGLHCDGQDGSNSHCARLRSKLFRS